MAGRLVAALLALTTLLLTVHFARRLVGHGRREDAAAFFATTILATSYAFVSFARLTMSDMLLTLLTLAAGGLYLRSEGESKSRLLVWSGALLGLGFLTKGPIAWIYFGALLAAVVIVERRLPRIFNGSGALGTVAAIAIASSWFLLVYLREGIEPLKWFFVRENLQRFAASTYDVSEPWWYYFAIYAVEGLPWSVLALPAAWFAFRKDAPRILRVLVVWSLLMLVPLSLSRGKIDYYLLPILPPLSLLIGAYLASGAPRWLLRLLSLLTAGLIAGALAFPMLPAPFAPPDDMIRALRVFLATACVASLIAAIHARARTVVTVGAATVLGTALFIFGAIVPAYRDAQPTAQLLDHIARERVYAPDLQVVVCDDSLRIQRDLLFTLRLPVVEECRLWTVVSSSRKSLILVPLLQERSLRTADRVRHIASLPHLPADVTRIGTLLKGAVITKIGLIANFETTDPVARWKRNREFKRWLDTPEGQKAEAERLEREAKEAEERRRAGGK